MNLKNIANAKGTGADTTDNEEPYSPRPFLDYLWVMFKILIVFFLFCYTTTNNYLNSLSIDTDKDYPIGTTLEGIIEKTGENPYSNRFFKCTSTEVASSDKVPKLKWWWQTTQETSYHLGGWLLHNYFDFSKNKGIGPTEISDTGILSFIRWVLFGAWTQFSIVFMLCTVFLTCIPGWFGGLFAYMNLNGDGLTKFLRFCLSALLTFVFGMVSVFPIFYEFFYLIYLFFFKQLTSNPDGVGKEFTKRMSNLIIVFVIVAIIVAAVELPPMTAGVIGGIVFLVHLFIKNKSAYSNSNNAAAPAN